MSRISPAHFSRLVLGGEGSQPKSKRRNLPTRPTFADRSPPCAASTAATLRRRARRRRVRRSRVVTPIRAARPGTDADHRRRERRFVRRARADTPSAANRPRPMMSFVRAVVPHCRNHKEFEFLSGVVRSSNCAAPLTVLIDSNLWANDRPG